jgi:hypothetical protein
LAKKTLDVDNYVLYMWINCKEEFMKRKYITLIGMVFAFALISVLVLGCGGQTREIAKTTTTTVSGTTTTIVSGSTTTSTILGTTTTITTTTLITTTTTSTSTTTTTTTVPGDVNGDGYADVLVGAYSTDIPETNTGQAYLYLGDYPVDFSDPVVFYGEEANDYFGYGLSIAGDVNGDSYQDIIIGADGADSSRGKAYIYFGGPSVDNIAELTLSGEVFNDYFGISVSTAGDVNGDGFSDVIVGADGADGGANISGRAYIYLGNSSMDNTVDLTLNGLNTGDEFGLAVACAGDVNGDGYSDVIVCAYRAAGGGDERGQVYIFFGGAPMDNEADIVISGREDNDWLGSWAASAGDVNGDGYADVIIGAIHADGGGTNRGQVYIYFGSPTMESGMTADDADITITGGFNDGNFGIAVACAGDIDGDGLSDVIIGAPRVDVGGTDAGQVYIYLGKNMGSEMDIIDSDFMFTGEDDNARLGQSVSSAGDLDKNGYDDMIAGAPGSGAGKAYIYLGGASSILPVPVTGLYPGGRFGESVSGARP